MFAHRMLCPPASRPRILLLSLLTLLCAAIRAPAVHAQSISLTADASSLPIRTTLHLSASTGVGATGTVTFLDGATPLASIPIPPSGTTIYASAILASGTHTFSATYSGDPTHPAATSSPATVVVTPILPPAFTVWAGAGVVFNSQPLSLTALGLPPDATGSVTFLDSGTPIASASITRASSPAYLSLGDDIPAGATLLSPSLAFPSLLAAEHAFTLTNNAVTGQAACDILFQQLVHPSLDFTQAGAPLSTLMVGSADTANPATEPTFQLCHQAALAWLAVPREFKVLSTDPGAVALTGLWTHSPDLDILYNNSRSGSAQFSITSTGAPLYVWYLLDQSEPGLFTISVDGVPDPTLYNAQPPNGTNTSNGLGFALLRIPVPAGPHVLQFTLQGGALGILAVGTPPSAADGSLHPTVLVSDLPNQNQAAPRDPAAITALFSADIQADIALLTADGLDLRLVPTQNFMVGAPDAMSDQIHPNSLGHTQLAAAFDSILPGVTPAAITTFLPNVPATSALLPTPGARTLTALYSGDSVYAPALSEPFLETVDDGATSTTLATPSLSVANPAPVPLSASVSPASAAGYITFQADGTLLATVPLVNGVGAYNASLATGTWSVTATFNPYDGRQPSTSQPLTVTVTRPHPSFSFSAQMQGQGPAANAAILTAYLAPVAVSGTVTFTESGKLLATVPIVDGAAFLPVPSLTPGTHTYTAAYSGDPVYAPLTSVPASVAVGPLATSLLATLVSNPNGVAGTPATIHVDVLAPAVPLNPYVQASFPAGLNATTAFMGDSITQWWPLPLNDHGIAGQTTTQMLARFASNILNHGYERVVLLGGTNDTLQLVDPSTTIANLSAMAAQAAAVGIRPILATIPPLSIPNEDFSLRVFNLNASIRALALQNGYALLDYYAALVQHPECFPDGTHPNLAGYAIMETVLAQTLIAPPGAVTLPDGTSSALSATGTAALTSTSIPAGPQQLTISFPGNATFALASATVQTNLAQAPTSTILSAQPLAGYTGNAVAFSASVQSQAILTPTGAVTFFDNGRPTGTAGLTGERAATYTASNLTPGTHAFTATYSGDATFTPSTSAPADLTTPFSNTSLTLSAPAPTSIAGTPITLTANLTPTSATGTITFADGNAILAQLPLAAGQAAFTTSTLALGPHALTAIYSGDPNDSIATSPVLALTIKPSPTILTLAPLPPSQTAGTSTLLTASITPATATGSITFLDSYTAPGQSQATTQTVGQATLVTGSATLAAAVLPTGTHVLSAAYAGNPADLPSTSAPITSTILAITSSITLATSQSTSAYGAPTIFTVAVLPATATGTILLRDSSGTTLAQAALANASAIFTLANLAVGPHTLTAAYSGDLSDSSSTSPPLTLTITPAPTTLTLAPVPAAIPAGSPITLSATLSAALSAQTATGSVTFRDALTGIVGQATLNNNTASLTLPTLTPGPYSFTAVYSGDPQDAPSLSNTVSTQVSLTPSTTTLSPPPTQLPANTPLTLTASISPIPASGSITFFDNTTPVGTTLLTNGSATLQVPSLAIGAHSLHAAFPGNTLLAASTSPSANVTVISTTTTTTLTLAQLNITDGDPLTFNVQVAASSSAPTGSITIRVGTNILASGTLSNAQGTHAFATLTAASTLLGPGTYLATAFYSGDPTNAPSDTSTTPISFTIVRPATTLTFTPASSTLPAQTPIALTAAVTGPSPAQIPTGTVTFLLNGTPILTANLDPTGTASATLPGQPVGVYAITAAYTPTGVFAPASAPTQTLTITPPVALAFPTSTVAMTPNAHTNATLLITPLSGFAGTIAAQCSTSVPFLTCTLDAPTTVSAPTSAVIHLALSNTTASIASRNPFVFAVLLLLPLAGRRSRRKLPFILLALAALTSPLIGCATGGDFNQIPTGYELVTVTVTANQTSAQAPLNVHISD